MPFENRVGGQTKTVRSCSIDVLDLKNDFGMSTPPGKKGKWQVLVIFFADYYIYIKNRKLGLLHIVDIFILNKLKKKFISIPVFFIEINPVFFIDNGTVSYF